VSIVREVHANGWRVRLDISRQVLRLEVPEAELNWHQGRWRTTAPPLLPLLPFAADKPVSAATLLSKAKQFDDSLFAEVELAAHQGRGRLTGKAKLLRCLAAALKPAGPGARTVIHTACELGGVLVRVPEDLAEAVRTTKAEFLDDELLSKPISFYAWLPELSEIFRQDRFLQQPLDAETADDLTRALEETPGALDAYKAHLRLAARLTNPPRKLGLRDAGKRPPLFPPSRSHEVTLFEKLYEDRPIPDNFELMTELIRCIRSGKLNLMPTDTSGWYDRQTWSLEPLIAPDRTPERGRLELGKRYREHLEALFRGALALARETHAKGAGGGRGGYGGPTTPPIWIKPNLTVEPLPTLYARCAAAYAFVRSVLEETFGADALNELRRLSPEGASRLGLAEELNGMEKLFLGAAATARQELGMQSAEVRDPAASYFSAWRSSIAADKDLIRDVRMMVPVFYDEQRRKTKVWAVLGWRLTTVEMEYRVPPLILGVEPSRSTSQARGGAPDILFADEQAEFAEPVMAEVYVSRLLNRDEFRKHCDRFKTRDAILHNLH
jgi:hypothetical protein